MLNNVLLLHYNNYYNRIVKKESGVAQYRLADTVSSVARYKDLTDVNFVPGDGITTKLVIGKGEMSDLELSSYDYVVVYNKDANNNETILHRWFILEYNRTRGGQYEISLRRDVIVDYNDKIANAPIFVEKAIIHDETSPLLYNNEGVNVNQIKTEEILLRDTTFCPWLVMYLKKNTLGNTSLGPNQDGTITIKSSSQPSTDITLSTPIGQWAYYSYFNGSNYAHINQIQYITRYQKFSSNLMTGYKKYTYNNVSLTSTVGDQTGMKYSGGLMITTNLNKAEMDVQTYANLTNLNTYVRAMETSNVDDTVYSYLKSISGKTIKDSDGKYFNIVVNEYTQKQKTKEVVSSTYTSLYNTMKNIFNTANDVSLTPTDKAFLVRYDSTILVCELQEDKTFEETIDFSGIEGYTVDSPLFDAICLPYGDFPIRVDGTMIYYNADRSLQLMNSLAKALSSSYVLDLQLLPYCPIQNKIVTLSYLNIDNTDGNAGLVCKYQNNMVDFIPIVNRATFTFDLTQGLSDASFETYQFDVSNAFKVKFYNDCCMARLCSPNYNGVFEFTIAKNGGLVNGFNVDITLRPYNPYIHINPKFDFLYGQDFNDARGLICGGDFSLGIINDAWVQYEIQNKNYQAIFDRQIENLDVNNAINKREAEISAYLGVMQGGMRGGIAGGIATGSPYGAAAGAAIGSGVAIYGGAMDLQHLAQRQAEARDFAIDNYNLQLGNVKALPNSITKTSAITANNKLFPFVELYTCTDVETDAYYKKIKYDGMTIGVIDELQNYVVEGEKNFFKGRLIRCEEIEEDNHMLQEINNELAKGVYI